ncbi:MAG: hypothetical protein DRJ02_06430 [Bacteroidetes bacterium]|nr:MAG: hypothetical protein DRJ02_06430 [Bacteroidota bacterium]
MKKIFLLIAISFSCFQLLSQCISVELSVFWDNKINPFSLNADKFCVPYLNITYRNNSDDSLYFLKVSQKVNDFPIILRGGIIEKNEVNNKLIKYGNYSKSQYLVRLGASPYYLNAWEVISDSIDPNKEHEIAIINDELADTYASLYNNYSDSINKIKIDYSASEITPEEILNKLKDKFVFVEPGEIYTDTYNLIGFKLLKGCYTFSVEPNSFLDYVNTSFFGGNNQMKYIYRKTTLPKVAGKYTLYTGKFNTNKITITF